MRDTLTPYKDPEVRRQYHKEYGACHYRMNKEEYKKRLSTPERNAKRRESNKRNRAKIARQQRVNKFRDMPGFDRVLRILDSGVVTCESCGSDHPGSVKGWCVDHDHKKNVVRGILCVPCNLVLGHVKDSIEHLKQLARFIETKSAA